MRSHSAYPTIPSGSMAPRELGLAEKAPLTNATLRYAGLFHTSRLARNMPMEAMMEFWPYVWRRFKSRFKTRLWIFGALLAIFLLLRFGLRVL